MALPSLFSTDKLRLIMRQIKERLWVKPLILCVLSVGGVFIAKLADDRGLSGVLPSVSLQSVESLLSIMASSMLLIATFAVGSMVAAYASASKGATPRSIPLVIADDTTQNALSVFLGAFIFSLVSLMAVQNSLFASAGLFAIFALTLLVFAIVIVTFVRWVDRIARLGREVNTIEQVEYATCRALDRRRHEPSLGALSSLPQQEASPQEKWVAVYSPAVGYVQNIDMKALQCCAEALSSRVTVTAIPGTFVCTRRPLLHIDSDVPFEMSDFSDCFTISSNRAFEDDPRFGLLALSEIADKALSPGINDPGTAINVIGTMVRLFTLWQSPLDMSKVKDACYDRISVPVLIIDDLFDDAFSAIARDGAGIIEVAIRLQKALYALSISDDPAMASAALKHSRMALARSEHVMTYEGDIEALRQVASFSKDHGFNA